MNRETSLYLDVVRFLAAATVFLAHASGQLFTGGFLWQLGDYQQTAVMVFFVLSGFVIGYVAHERERSLSEYWTSRISRLGSVVVPALLLTFLCDFVGLRVDRAFYFDGPWSYPAGDQTLNYVLSLFLLQDVWSLDLNPGSNRPFWSLSYELMYYAIFASIFYLSGVMRNVSVALLCILSGPTILLLMPIWCMGYGCYLMLSRYASELSSRRILFSVISIAALAGMVVLGPRLREQFSFAMPYVSRHELVADYFDGIMFALHLLFCLPLVRFMGAILERFSSAITYLASLTFALYLFHRPLIQVLGALRPDEPSSPVTRLFIIGGTFLVVLVFGRWCEKQKHTIKSTIRALHRRSQPSPSKSTS